MNWVAPSLWEAHYGSPSRAAMDTLDEAYPVRTQSSLFPAVLQTSRLPYADGSLFGLELLGSDLTERLSWSAFTGWDFLLAKPELSLAVELGAGAWQLSIGASDKGAFTTPVSRVSALEGALQWSHTFVPTFKNVGANFYGAYGAIHTPYPIGFFTFAPDYSAWALGTQLYFDSRSNSVRLPYDPIGIVTSLGLEYEASNSAGFGGPSLAGAVSLGDATLANAVGAGLYAAIAPIGGVSFKPHFAIFGTSRYKAAICCIASLSFVR